MIASEEKRIYNKIVSLILYPNVANFKNQKSTFAHFMNCHKKRGGSPVKCNHCQSEIPENSPFCPECGQKVTPDQNRCRKCQAPLSPGAQFCESCGEPVTPAESICPVCSATLSADALFCRNCGYQRQSGAPKANAFTQQNPPVPPPPSYGGPQPAYGMPPKKKKKGWLVAVIIILVLAIAGGVTALVAGKQIKRLLMGPKATYLSIETGELKKQCDELVSDLVRFGNADSRDLQGGADLELKASLNAGNLSLDPTLATVLDQLSIHATWIYDNTESENESYATLDLLSQNERLLTIEAFMEPNRLVLGVPDILDQYMMIQYSDLGSIMGTDEEEIDESISLASQLAELDLHVNEPALRETLYKAVDIFLKYIDSVEYEKKQPLTVGSVTVHYDLYTVTLSSENAKAMLLELLNLAREDHEIYNLASQFTALASAADPDSSGAELTLSDYQNAIDDVIEEIENNTDDEPFTLIQKVYVDTDDHIVGRDVKIVDSNENTLGQFQIFRPESKTEGAYLFSVVGESGSDSVEFKVEYTLSDDKKTGTADLYSEGSRMLHASFQDCYFKTINGADYPLGMATLAFESEDVGMPSTIIYKGWEENERFWMELGIQDLIAVDIGYKKLSQNARIPIYDGTNLVDLSDPEKAESIFNESALSKLYEIMEKLGLSDYISP